MDLSNPGRRRFLAYSAAAAAIPLVLKALPAQAAPAALPKLTAANPQAKALAYTENAAAVKHPVFKAGSNCANCTLYKGAKGQAYGPCTLFPQNTVAAKGWCSAWAKKA
ncbi:high-potential iron-sulfur protein [Lysobacter olei]